MKRFLVASLVVCPALFADDSAFQKTVQPFLSKHCISCHNDKLKSANLNLSRVSATQPEVWEKVLDKLNAGKMPPLGQPVPSKAELASVTSWIEARSGKTQDADPGRVTARRLNRVEYNNTIRDLLGVPIRPADEFPVDDSGYGFDNIGDVLSVSPMLMEKYMTAARRVARLAVYGETLPAKPSRITRLLNSRSGDASDAHSKESSLPYSIRGAMYGSFVFPVDGEYEFRLRVANFRGDSERTPLAGLTPQQEGITGPAVA